MTKQTKFAIEQTFLALIDDHPLKDIDIKDITDACGVNRNTFYYYYKNIPDLIESIVKTFVNEIIDSHPPTYDRLEDCFVAAISLAKEHQQAIYHIYNSTNRSIFERHLWHVCDYSITSFVNSLPPSNPPLTPGEQSILKDLLKYECFGFVIDWINKKMPDDVMVKVEILSNCLRNRALLPVLNTTPPQR